MDKANIAILAGGWSGEREISLKSGRAVFNAVDRRKYEVRIFDPRDEFEEIYKAKNEIDLALIMMHGKFGEDGKIQGMLEVLGIPFAGSGVLASALSLNKRITKALYRNAGLNTAKDVVIRKNQNFSIDKICSEVGLKVVVKPVSEGSSLGISICEGKGQISSGIAHALKHDQEALVEKFIEGREVTCGVLGFNPVETLPVIEIVPDKKYPFFDYEAKYKPGATKEICPAKISDEEAEKVREYAKTAHEALGCSLWSRTDMILKEGSLFALETNTIPGMTENSLFPLAARTAGMSLTELVDKMISFSLENMKASKEEN